MREIPPDPEAIIMMSAINAIIAVLHKCGIADANRVVDTTLLQTQIQLRLRNVAPEFQPQLHQALTKGIEMMRIAAAMLGAFPDQE